PVHVYGLTETYGPHTVCEWHAGWDALLPEEQARLAARQGQGYANFDLVRIVDTHMNDVPRDGETLGEVVMRGNNVMLGYFEQPDATAEAFRGGWFHSGDIGVWHPDGYIELRDRKKDIIISGGENISTIEVEQCVARHPAVMECAVVAVPDERWGERPKAFVTLKPGHQTSEREIIDFCKQHIAHFKAPAAVVTSALIQGAMGLTLTALVASGSIRYWHVATIAVVWGLVNALDTPARQAFLVDLVGREDVGNAIALNSVAFNGARIVGPAVAGVLIGAFGLSSAFLLNAFA